MNVATVKLWQQKAADTEKGQLDKMSTEFYECQTVATESSRHRKRATEQNEYRIL